MNNNNRKITTSIAISKELREEIAKEGGKDETWDDLISRIFQGYKSFKAIK